MDPKFMFCVDDYGLVCVVHQRYAKHCDCFDKCEAVLCGGETDSGEDDVSDDE
jgi:hypothetical protein